MPLIGREVERPATLVTQSPQGTVSSVFGLGRTFDPEMDGGTETQTRWKQQKRQKKKKKSRRQHERDEGRERGSKS